MTQTPLLSICIVNLNARAYLQDCLASFYAHPPACPFEVIVVDNASTDGSLAMLRERFPQVAIIENDTNLGYTAPMNQALRAARGEYCVQLNPDTLVVPAAFDTMLAFMQANPDVGICTPKVLNRDKTLQKQCRRSAAGPWDVFTYFSGLSRLFPRSKTFAGYLMTWRDEDEIHEVQAVSGSCMVIRRAVMDQIGLLDEDFFAYQEDSDYCMRARQAGWRIMYVPTAQIIHFGGQGGSGSQVYRSVLEWHRSYFHYYRKHFAPVNFFLVNWAFYLGMGLKTGVALFLLLLRKRKIAGTPKP